MKTVQVESCCTEGNPSRKKRRILSFQRVIPVVLISIICCIFAQFASITSVDADQRLNYKRYANVRFGYSISYPEGVLFPQGEADNSDGQRFLSKLGDVEMVVSGINNVLDETIQSRFKGDSKNEAKKNYVKRVVYKYLKGNVYVVSGFINEKIYYQKTILENDAFMTFYISYPADKKQQYDPITVDISKSFKFVGTTAR